MKEDLESKIEKDPYKSEGERKIAQFLKEAQIPFIYEKETLIKDQGKLKIWYPDFTLPEYQIIIEYYGINGNPEYSDAVRYKQRAYKENNLDALPIYPEHLKNDYRSHIARNVKQALYKRINNFENTLNKLKGSYKIE